MMKASTSSSGYTAQRKNVPDLLIDSERHFLGTNIDQGYEDMLGEQVKEAEDICTQKDLEMDTARKVKKDAETSNKDLLAILPKGLGSKFHGDAGSWPSFRKYFISICENLEPTVAAATMKNLIKDRKLKKSTHLLRTGQAG